MPISLTELRNRKAPLSIDVGDGEKINLEYYPHKITPGYLDKVSKETDLMALSRTVAEFVADWDIEQEPGIKLAVDADGASQLGIALLNLIISETAQDIRNPLAARKIAKR